MAIFAHKNFPPHTFNFVTAAVLKKTRMIPIKDHQQSFDNMSIRLGTLLALDGQTDRSGKKITLCMHCMLTCINKKLS